MAPIKGVISNPEIKNSKVKPILSSDHATLSRKELFDLFENQPVLARDLIKKHNKEAIKTALEAVDISQILSEVEHMPSFLKNKTARLSKKMVDRVTGDALEEIFQKDYEMLPDFSKKEIENKPYKGLVTSEKPLTVCIGKIGKTPVEYEISQSMMKSGKLLRGDSVFVDISKNGATLTTKYMFNKFRSNKLNDLGIHNSNQIISYTTQEGKKMSGRIIGYGEDPLGNEVVFKPLNGSSFALSILTLKKGMQPFKKEAEPKKKISLSPRINQELS